MNFLISIVPGAGGGVAMCVDGIFDCRPMPPTETELAKLLRTFRKAAEPAGYRPLCLMEQTQPLLTADASREGLIRGIVLGLDYELVPVTPAEWQQTLSLQPAWNGAHPVHRRLKLQHAAQLFFPNLDITPGTAVALTILLWGMQVRAGRATSEKS